MEQYKHLITDYKTGKEIDIDRLMDDLSGYVKTIINNMAENVLSFEDKEEILSDVFFILWKNQNKVDTTVEAYAGGITRILVKEKLRKKKVLQNIDDYENLVIDKSVFDLEGDIYECEYISEYINKLKSIDVQILSLFYYQSRTTKEISAMLNISEINVRTRLFRLKNKIRKEFKINKENGKGGI